MLFETCPLLDELSWLKHAFYGQNQPHAVSRDLSGEHIFNDIFAKARFFRQTHSNVVAFDGHDPDMPADAALTAMPYKALAIKTADCCPILLVCTNTRQVAAVHAGWRGALNGITLKAIEAMLANGALPETLIAAIGPSIAQANYPVQDDVRKLFAGDVRTLGYFKPAEDRFLLDVAGIIFDQIEQMGVTQLWRSQIDTYADPRYASYRQYHYNAGIPEARNISLIMKTA